MKPTSNRCPSAKRVAGPFRADKVHYPSNGLGFTAFIAGGGVGSQDVGGLCCRGIRWPYSTHDNSYGAGNQAAKCL